VVPAASRASSRASFSELLSIAIFAGYTCAANRSTRESCLKIKNGFSIRRSRIAQKWRAWPVTVFDLAASRFLARAVTPAPLRRHISGYRHVTLLGAENGVAS
jgi:hypothetical protein